MLTIYAFVASPPFVPEAVFVTHNAMYCWYVKSFSKKFIAAPHVQLVFSQLVLHNKIKICAIFLSSINKQLYNFDRDFRTFFNTYKAKSYRNN